MIRSNKLEELKKLMDAEMNALDSLEIKAEEAIKELAKDAFPNFPKKVYIEYSPISGITFNHPDIDNGWNKCFLSISIGETYNPIQFKTGVNERFSFEDFDKVNLQLEISVRVSECLINRKDKLIELMETAKAINEKRKVDQSVHYKQYRIYKEEFDTALKDLISKIEFNENEPIDELIHLYNKKDLVFKKFTRKYVQIEYTSLSNTRETMKNMTKEEFYKLMFLHALDEYTKR